MSYENLSLRVTAITGEIVLGRIKKDGMMADGKRYVTDDCIKATTEWFAANEKKAIQFEEDESGRHSLFYTHDPKKAEKIIKILQEG